MCRNFCNFVAGKKLAIMINIFNLGFALFLFFCKKEPLYLRLVGLCERLLIIILNFMIIFEVPFSFCCCKKDQIEDEKKKEKEDKIINDAQNLMNMLNKEIEILEALKAGTNPTMNNLLLKLKNLKIKRQELYAKIFNK